MKTRTSATCFAAVAALLVSATPAAPVANPPPPSDDDLLFVHVEDVIEGRIGSSAGNRHQLVLRNHFGEIDGYIRSWFCPEGVTVTPTWASSHCVHRKTQDLRERWGHEPDRWISSTGRSASIEADNLVAVNRDTGYRRVLPTHLTFHEEAAEMDYAAGMYVWEEYRYFGHLGDTGIWSRPDGVFGWPAD